METHFNSIMPDAVSVPYPYSMTLDGNGPSLLSASVEDSAGIDGFCEKHNHTADSYIRGALLCALQRILRQDGLVLFVRQSLTLHPSPFTPLAGSMEWMELSAGEMLKLADAQFARTSQSAGNLADVHLLYTPSLYVASGEGVPEGDLIRFFSGKTEDGSYILSLTYNPELYSRRDMQALLDAWLMLVTEFCRQDCPVNRLPIVTPEERDRLLALGDGDVRNPYNSDDYDLLPENVTIVENFIRIAHESPQKPIVVDSEGSYTCEQLNFCSNKVAHWLMAQGIQQGSVIGVLTSRCKEYLALAIGILKAGCAIVTLEEDYPTERRQQIIEDASVKLILTLDSLRSIIDSDADDSDICLCTVESTFQIFFTSGSTGKPKGVVRLMSELTYDMNNGITYRLLTEDAASINIVRFSFVACIADIWLSVTHGNPAHIISYKMLADQSVLANYLWKNNITYALMPSSYGIFFVNNYDLPLRNLLLSAEKIQPVTNRKVVVTNLYASTEVLWVTSKVILPDSVKLTAGIPQSGTQVYILDENQQLLPQGTIGEICISSTTLAKEYLNNPELNAQNYIDNPFINNKTMLRSKDLGYLDENGELNIVGRIDNMVKLRGFRVDLDDIAYTATKCQGVDMCACVKIEKGGNETICCYYTSSEEVSKEVLNSFLAKKFPPYMIPGIYMLLDKMPLNDNGKIDRKVLPEPEYRPESIVLPATKDERQILEIVESLIGISPVSVTANLISLGLTSIAAMRLAMRLSKELGRTCPEQGRRIITMSQLMAAPTIRDIAANLSVAEDSSLGLIREKQKYYPLIDNQLGVYLDWEQHREGLQYNIPYALKLKGGAGPEQCRWNAERLKTAVEAVVAAHPYLNARLAVVDGEVMLQRRDEDRYMCDITVLDARPNTVFFQSRVRPFNLFEDSLCRFEIYTYEEDVYLFLDIHHIITDGLSDAMLAAEIFKAYNGEAIESETFTAFDRALEEQEIKQSEAYSQAKNYYSDLLAGLESTSYPHSTSDLGNGKAGYVSHTLNKSAIEQHCSRLGVTAGNYLLTVFMEVLKRITRDEKVLITTINSGREHIAMQDIQGFFVKTLPVVSADTVAEVQRQLIESISHECYPLTVMVQSLGIRPEIMYAYEGGLFESNNAAFHDGGHVLSSVEEEVISLSLDTTKVPLTLTVNPDGVDFDLSIEYDDSLYNETDMQTLLHSIIVLAENYTKQNEGSKNASVSLQDCSMLTEEEEQRLIKLGTGETLDYDKSKTFIDLFREQAAKTPDAVAVVDGYGRTGDNSGLNGSQLTYKELDEASDEYAKTVTPGTFVCLELPRVKEFVVAVLGIWKAGSAYVPIDTEYPEERKQFMREECDGKPLPSPNIAYMIYTSGSTGKPKGVMVQHPALMNFVTFIAKEWKLRNVTRISCHSNFAFDASVEDLYPVLTVGGSLFIVPEDVRMNIDLMYGYIVSNDITGGLYSTQVGQILLEQYPNLPVDYIVIGGEKMPSLNRTNSNFKIYNGYGPTEFTVCSSYYELSDEMQDNVPIGRPVPGSQSFICDRAGHLLPQSATGELCLAGHQMALGYYNNPELTAERFVDVTIGGKTVKIYKTGDLCRWNEDGQLEYIGRIDNQVKLRGYRIELGEIESAALQIENIRQAVAMVRNERIVLYYTEGSAGNGSNRFGVDSNAEDAIRHHLSSSLPEYMIPGAFVRLDAMPLTPNGKIDRKALPEPEFVQEEYIAPRNAAEQIIADIFKEVLNLSDEACPELCRRVSVTSRFYSLGGDSIKSIRLVSLLSQKGYRLSVADVMKLQTPEALAAVAVATDTEEESFALPFPIEKRYPLTPMQEAMLLKQMAEPDSWGYRLVSRYRLNVIPTEAQLRATLDALAIEHETLRTRIIYKDVESPEQEITDRHIPLSFEDIRKTGRTPEEIHTEQLNLGFDLQEDPLMRVVCIVTGEKECQLLIAMHHIITDGWSTPIYLGHLFRHLKDALDGKEVLVAETDAGLFEQHVRSLMLRDKDESLSYWKSLLDGYETKAEITSYDDDNDDGNDHLGLSLDIEQTERLKAVCAANGATLSHATELAWGIVLQRYTRLDDVIFAKVVSCRDKAPMDMSNVVGPFINSIPVRVKSERNETLSEALQSVSNQAAESNAHDYCSLSEIQQQSELGSNLFQSILAFENYPVSDEIRGQFEGSNSVLHIEALDNQEESFNDISLSAFEHDGRLHLNLTFDKKKFSEAEMQNALSAWKQVLMQVANTPDVCIAEVSLLSEDEEQQLIVVGTGEDLEYDKSKTFIDLFREQAAKTPDAVAVVDGYGRTGDNSGLNGSQLTYKELDEASDEYAKTVTPGTFVCLELPRVKEFVVAVLGIWKAGSAYVPIDTEYPEERKQFMREECDGKPLPSPNIAYMIYTSGSTGKPKGVMVQHPALMNFVTFIAKEWKLRNVSRISCHSNFAFDASVEDLYPVLTVGGSLFIVPEDVRMNIDLMYGYIVSNNITGGSYPTQVGQILLEQYPNLPVDYIVIGGEKMTANPSCNCRLINAYGPTECTVDASYFELGHNISYDNIPIGRPLDNLQSFICDEQGHLLPQGTTGELCIAGPQLAFGYYNNSELTAEKFVDVTIGGKTIKIYKTGDLCRWNADCQLEYIGRIDNQIKLRGFRIELGEIESAALKIEGVQQAVALVRNEKLVLYYTGVEFRAENLELRKNLLSELRSHLPEYMTPSALVQLEAMPLNSNGKIDRKALPEPTFVQKEYVAPKSRKEKLICKAIEELLSLERIGTTDSFRSNGMSSIQAMQLNMVLHKLDFHVSLDSILKADNVRNLCQCIDEGMDNTDVGVWLNVFDATKPTIVLCCGVINDKTITNNLSGFNEKYNIYVLLPMFDVWADIEELSHEEIVSRYLEIMMRDILRPGSGQVQIDISCIMGFSYGGELAYHLAVRWNTHTGQKPMVFMGDTGITAVQLNDLQQPAYKNEMDAYYYELQYEFFSKRKRLPVSGYQGRVILISAEKEKESSFRIANEQEWRVHNAHINIIPINDTHQGLFKNAEHYDEYLSLIEKISAHND